MIGGLCKQGSFGSRREKGGAGGVCRKGTEVSEGEAVCAGEGVVLIDEGDTEKGRVVGVHGEVHARVPQATNRVRDD